MSVLLTSSHKALLRTIKDWPNSIYDVGAVIVAVKSELDRAVPSTSDTTTLMECLAELYVHSSMVFLPSLTTKRSN